MNERRLGKGIRVRLPEDVTTLIAATAERLGTTSSAVARAAILLTVENYDLDWLWPARKTLGEGPAVRLRRRRGVHKCERVRLEIRTDRERLLVFGGNLHDLALSVCCFGGLVDLTVFAKQDHTIRLLVDDTPEG